LQVLEQGIIKLNSSSDLPYATLAHLVHKYVAIAIVSVPFNLPATLEIVQLLLRKNANVPLEDWHEMVQDMLLAANEDGESALKIAKCLLTSGVSIENVLKWAVHDCAQQEGVFAFLGQGIVIRQNEDRVQLGKAILGTVLQLLTIKCFASSIELLKSIIQRFKKEGTMQVAFESKDNGSWTVFFQETDDKKEGSIASYVNVSQLLYLLCQRCSSVAPLKENLAQVEQEYSKELKSASTAMTALKKQFWPTPSRKAGPPGAGNPLAGLLQNMMAGLSANEDISSSSSARKVRR